MPGLSSMQTIVTPSITMQIKKHPQHDIALEDEIHPKQDFQVERIAFFSDAVFAIALTLLVIEFKPPFIGRDTTPDIFFHELREMRFKLLAVLLSFFLIVVYW